MALSQHARSVKSLTYASGAFGLGVSAMAGLLVPLRAHDLGISLGVIGLVVAARAATEALCSMPLGRFIDWIGTKRAFVLGTVICVIAGLGFAWASSVISLILSQIAFGMGRTLGWVGSQAYVSTLSRTDNYSIHTGRFIFASYLSQVACPALAGFVAGAAGYQWAFMTMSTYALVFTGLGLYLPSQLSGEPQPRRVRTGAFVRDPRIRGALMLTFIRLWIGTIWNAFYPVLLMAAGFTVVIAGLVVTTSSLVGTAMSLTVGRFTRRASPLTVTGAGLALGATGVIISPLVMTDGYVFIPAVLLGIGGGLSLPLLITIVSSAAPVDSQGLALGTRATVNQVSSAIAPVAIAPLIEAFGLSIGFPIGGGVALAAILATLFLARSRARSV